MSESTLATSKAGDDNGFFSTLLEGLGVGISRVAADVLPVWTAQQLDVQKEDQLFRSTYTPIYQNVSEAVGTGGSSTAQAPSGSPSQGAGLFDLNIGGTHMDATTVLLLIAAGLGTFYLVRKVF